MTSSTKNILLSSVLLVSLGLSSSSFAVTAQGTVSVTATMADNITIPSTASFNFNLDAMAESPNNYANNGEQTIPYSVEANTTGDITMQLVTPSGTRSNISGTNMFVAIGHNGALVDNATALNSFLPIEVYYVPCGNTGSWYQISGGASTFPTITLTSSEFAPSVCSTSPGFLTAIRLPVKDSSGTAVEPQAGSYSGSFEISVSTV